MTQDGLTLYYTVLEIKDQIIGCKVDKIHQPKPDTIVLGLRAPAKNPRLLICAGASDSRLHLTARKYENPKFPPSFCMFLRKHISGAKVAAVEQTGLERIVTITLQAKDELGLTRNITLIAELMGKHSNIMLVKDEIIMDSMRRVTSSQSRVRSVLPGLAYKTPRSDKLNPLHISRSTLIEMLKKRGGANIKTYLSSFLAGLSGQSADEILYRYLPLGYKEQPKEAERLSDIILGFFSESPKPVIYLSGKVPFFYSPFRFAGIAAEPVGYNSFNSMVDDYYAGISLHLAFAAKRGRLSRITEKQLEKQIATLQKQQVSAQMAKKADIHKMRGDIITANIYRITKGQRILAASDYATGADIAIELDTRVSPAANAQRQYKRYSKLKAGLDVTLRRIKETQNDIVFLESVLHSLDLSESECELAEIEYELFKAGFMPRRQANASITKTPSKPHKFISSDGYTIYAGKNNRQNDLLTMKTAEPDDIWLHTKDIPGSHVLITGARGMASDIALLEAAKIAATLSKAKNGAKVRVDYAPRKNVRKPNGAKPGMVVYEGHSSILVSPDKTLLERLKSEQ
ncbi:MAG: NFACT RNA binding domain-containing protein [Christensenellales bacterium]